MVAPKPSISARCLIPTACLLIATQTVQARQNPETPPRKPGLYDLTVTTTTLSPSRGADAPRTRQVCLTQQMIDKYGAIVPENLTKVCQIANVVKKPSGMTADIACKGGLNGDGTLQVNWSDSEHAKGSIAFSGTMHPGDHDIKIEWSATTLSVYKGPDCTALPTSQPAASPASPSAPPS